MCSKWCSGSEPGAADGMCTDSKGDLTRFPTDVVIKADMLFPCVKNTSLPGAKSDWARCEGPAQGARPQPGKPTDPQQDCGSANWPQIPPGFSEGGTKMRGKKKKRRRRKNCKMKELPLTIIPRIWSFSPHLVKIRASKGNLSYFWGFADRQETKYL